MPCYMINGAIICCSREKSFEAGSMPPNGYLDWHLWAEAQYRGGLRQSRCSGCGKMLFPHEAKVHECEGPEKDDAERT